jgi:hypothetical protein
VIVRLRPDPDDPALVASARRRRRSVERRPRSSRVGLKPCSSRADEERGAQAEVTEILGFQVRTRGNMPVRSVPRRPETPRGAASPAGERLDGDRGVALVEFALVFPILIALIIGMVSAGLAWNQKLQLTHGAREGARYGAIVDSNQTFDNGLGWGRNVLDVTIARAGSDLEVDGATACVSLVRNSPGVVYSTDHVARATRSCGSWSYTTGGAPCISGQTYPVSGAADIGLRAQVVLDRPGTFETLFITRDLNLTASATAKSEGNE